MSDALDPKRHGKLVESIFQSSGVAEFMPQTSLLPLGSTLKWVPIPCLLLDELESWNPSDPVLYGLWGRTLVFSSIRVAQLNINIGRTNLETRGDTHTTLAKVPSADLDLPVFERRRFKYPIFGDFLSRYHGLAVIPVYSRPARNVQIRDMFWFTVIIAFIPTFLLSHPSLLLSNNYKPCPLVFSYPIGASPDVVHLAVDFVEQDGFGLVTSITSLFGIVHFSSHHDGDEQRTVSIANTSMLPASMVEEADLLTCIYYVYSNGRSKLVSGGSDVVLTRSDHSLNEDVKQPVAVKLDDYVDPPSWSTALNRSTSPQGLCTVLNLTMVVDTFVSRMDRLLKCTTASSPIELFTQRMRRWSIDKTDMALIKCATACAIYQAIWRAYQGVGVVRKWKERWELMGAWNVFVKGSMLGATAVCSVHLRGERWTYGVQVDGYRLGESKLAAKGMDTRCTFPIQLLGCQLPWSWDNFYWFKLTSLLEDREHRVENQNQRRHAKDRMFIFGAHAERRWKSTGRRYDYKTYPFHPPLTIRLGFRESALD
ncbi:hypothetical protein ARMGADRAFT_1088497 [Armillaria gallica]|uniref:Uncharacterized protein n=1 Tax=Armillaria gallica TaxID=47427 RepID=A0A2H3D5B6_ARMGA|nr:hypothetical protein ARMGADRAFT_1088497 [Armillaria gallica]